MKLSKVQTDYLRNGRVARLATIDKNNSVSLVPIVYASVGSSIYFVIDRKKKREGNTLKRLRNITENGKATLLVDIYSEDWGDLSYLLIRCEARIIGPEQNLREKSNAAKALKKKYKQYEKGNYFPEDTDKAIFVKLEPLKAVFWQNLRHSVA